MSCAQCDSTGIWVPKSATIVDGKWKTTHYPERAKPCPLCDGFGNQLKMWPFSNGTEYGSWTYHNCDACMKRYDEERRQFRCDIEEALGSAYMSDGLIVMEIAKRAGLNQRRPECLERLEEKSDGKG